MKEDEFLKLGNHREARRILGALPGVPPLVWFDAAAALTARRWFRLSEQHLRVSQLFIATPRAWRAAISRSYYAVYNASKSVRFYVSGRVSRGTDDHAAVGDLPKDFPNRPRWTNFTTELRRDRNLADYEPWRHVRRSLTYQPPQAIAEAKLFVAACRTYLRGKGLTL